jgi:hypothetical protein
VSSVIVKAYPLLDVAESTVTFVGGNVTVPNVVNSPSSATLGSNSSVSIPVVVKDLDNFWRGVDMVYAFRKDIVDGGGTTSRILETTRSVLQQRLIYFACQSQISSRFAAAG